MILRQISAFQILFPSSCMTRVAVSIIWIFTLILEMIQTWLIFFNWWFNHLDADAAHASCATLLTLVEGRGPRGPYPSAKVNAWRSSNVWRTRWHRQLGHQRTTKRCTESFGNVPSKIGDLIWWVWLGKDPAIRFCLWAMKTQGWKLKIMNHQFEDFDP